MHYEGFRSFDFEAFFIECQGLEYFDVVWHNQVCWSCFIHNTTYLQRKEAAGVFIFCFCILEFDLPGICKKQSRSDWSMKLEVSICLEYAGSRPMTRVLMVQSDSWAALLETTETVSPVV